MDLMHNLLSFMLAIGILVGFHEFGHFWVARLLGIRVLNFSIGFGPKLAGWRDQSGCEYQLALVPLGGYVRMLDESEGPVPEALKSQAFNQKPVWVRMAVVVAGPLANLVLAVAIYTALFTWGVERQVPRLDAPIAASIAEQAGFKAGMELVQIGDEAVQDWESVLFALSSAIGDSKLLPVRVLEHGQEQELWLNLQAWQLDESRPDLLASLGLKPAQPPLAPVLENLQPNGPAAMAGLLAGDRILSLAGIQIDSWQQLVTLVRERPNQAVTLVVERDGKQQEISVSLASRDVSGKLQGFIGTGVHWHEPPAGWVRTYQLGPIAALTAAVKQTAYLMKLSAQMLAKLVSGQLSLKSLSGPVAIAEGAGQSAHYGLVYYLGFIAFISINIGFLNLLPVPVLDGGMLVLLAIEGLRHRALPELWVTRLRNTGWVLVMGLTILALSNDLSRLFG
jgi:regulator of sigma E protease